MNKSLPLQNNKVFSSYGGVGSMIDTIDDLSIMIDPFDKWAPLYDQICAGRHRELEIKEPRLCAMVKSIGFDSLEGFFKLDTSLDDDPGFKAYAPRLDDKNRMVKTTFFPSWFYCPKCHEFKPLQEWRDSWLDAEGLDDKFDQYAPACSACAKQKGNGKRPRIQQTRFVMASMESGEIMDIPWRKVFAKKGRSDSSNALVWRFDRFSEESQKVEYHVSDASTNLARIYVKNEHGVKVSMAEIFSHYFVIAMNGETRVFRPVVRSDNNVYFGYNLNCIYIPEVTLSDSEVNSIKDAYENGIVSPTVIKRITRVTCSEATIQQLIDENFQLPEHSYSSEDAFRKEEFDFLTNGDNYSPLGDYVNPERRLISHVYTFNGAKPHYIKSIHYQSRLNVTTVQLAYSRIDKLSPTCIPQWGGQNNPAKEWYIPALDTVDSVDVALHPTCQGDKGTILRMPALSSYGEGFLVELDLETIPDLNHKLMFLHTFSHLLIKELEFVCGYPAASMNERLYFFPEDKKYGFLIYSIGGAAGSYGGITSIFQSNDIERIIQNASERASDCSNDPICESEGGHCFACVHLPETSCERFNQELSRNIFNQYK